MILQGYSQLAPVYPLIAQQIVDDYGITQGICCDIGTGPGFVGIELAKITNLEMYFIDDKQEALDKAEKNVSDSGLDNKVHFTKANVCMLPFEDGFADFVISRGSLWFWDDQVKGLQQIYRILKPGGIAFVGGGLGRYSPASMRNRLKGMGKKKMQKQGKGNFLNGDGLKVLLEKTMLDGCRTISDVEGEEETWIEMRK
ncbi:class I SAM-dependent methyltransferase [uncultured Desulfobacter sp.]|uniref:class I SAM-dependent methyltransferase n=1 Tax=uncultured Desulfobacter sp. TaxID=240139 RepID=UPI002AABF627|nr:class I SAM-dependent methyltransferase [uncultured Desulfobacter sp.]